MSSSYSSTVVGERQSGLGLSLKLPRLTSVSYAKWRPEAENCFKRIGLKESDYKKEIKSYGVKRAYVESLDEQEADAADAWLLKKQSGASASAAVVPSNVKTEKVVAAGDNTDEKHDKVIRGIVDRSMRVFTMLYECLADDVRVLVNHNKLIVDGYGYSLWKWLESKYQSTEGDSIGKLWGEFVNAKQSDDELFDVFKARVDAVVELLAAAGQKAPPALYATILLDRLCARYSQIKMTVDSTKELGKDRTNIDWSAMVKFIQAQERNLTRISEAGVVDLTAEGNPAQAMSAAAGGFRSSARPQGSRRFAVSRIDAVKVGLDDEGLARVDGDVGESSDGDSRPGSIGQDRSEVAMDLPFRGKDCCWFCGVKGHSFKECRKRSVVRRGGVKLEEAQSAAVLGGSRIRSRLEALEIGDEDDNRFSLRDNVVF